MPARRRSFAMIGAVALLAGAATAVPITATAAPADQIRITEWEYNGSEFVEFTNLGDSSVDLTGWSFSDSARTPGAVSLSGVGTVAAGESFILSEVGAAAFRTEWGLSDAVKVVGGNTANLGRSDEVNIYDASSTLVDRLTYNDQGTGSVKGPRTDVKSAWVPVGSLGANAASSWVASGVGDAEASWASVGGFIGSPGQSSLGAAYAWHAVKINEVNSDTDTVELVNTGGLSVDVSGWKQTDSGHTPGALVGLSQAVIPAHGYVTFTSNQGLSAGGDGVRLYLADGTTQIDAVTYGANEAEPGSYSSCPDGGSTFSHVSTATFGATNTPSCGGEPEEPGEPEAPAGWEQLRINEVTSANADPTHDAYELVNTGDADVDVAALLQSDSGSAPAALTSPNGTVVPAHGYLVLLSNQGLSSGGDSVKLYLPDGTTIVDSVTWGTNDAEPGSWARCQDATGGWVHTATASWGTSNATACAGTIIPTSPGSAVPCQSEAPSGTGPALTGGIAWPGSQDATQSDTQCQFVTALSGQDVSGLDVDPSDANVLWAAKNKSHVFRLVKSGSLWLNDTANGWVTGKDITFPGGTGLPDSEGITVGPDGFLYVTTERDNGASSVPLESVLRYDPNATGTTLQPTTQWVLTSDFAGTINGSADSNLGFEGITWVPDSYLTEYGFVDQTTGLPYDPSNYSGHGTGLYFLGLEKNGHLYAYALNDDGTHARVADIPTGLSFIADTQWDADNERIWAVADNSVSGSAVIMKIDDAGAIVPEVIYDRPTNLPNDNLEGFALAPDTTAVGGVKEVIRADDGNNGGHSLWSGTIKVDLGLGEQGSTHVFTSVPKAGLSGVGEVGRLLTISSSTAGWGPMAPTTVTYDWLRDGVSIGLAPDTTSYRLTNADAGHTISVLVSGSRSGFATAAKLSYGKAVTGGEFVPVPRPALSGVPEVGRLLTVATSLSAWGPVAPTAVTYDWLRDGISMGLPLDATSYRLTTADAGHSISVLATGSRPGFVDATKVSVAKAITGGKFAPVPKASLSGVSAVGRLLTVGTSLAGWGPVAPSAVTYDWLRDGVSIGLPLDTTSYRLTAADAGHTISVLVTGSRPGFDSISKLSYSKSIPA